MTPCDGTANSTKWCCGDNTECCTGEIGVETLAQTFLGMLTTSASQSPAATASSSPLSDTETGRPASLENSAKLSGGAIAGIVVGTLAGVALLGATLFVVLRRRRSAKPSAPIYIEKVPTSEVPKAFYAHEADGDRPQVSEVPAATIDEIDGRGRVHEM